MDTTDTKMKQRGFVSIIVAALIMIILSLITIGFTRLMQREQRQSIDRQLTRQALYAAESGINDVYDAIKANPNLPDQKTTCDVTSPVDNGEPNPAENSGLLSSTGDIAYTCVLYDKTPTELVYSLSTSESDVVELKTASGNPFSSLRFRWGNEQGNNDVTSLPDCGVGATGSETFLPSRPGNTPLLRLDLTNTQILSRDNLISGTDYLYLSPCKGGSGTNTYAYMSGGQGKVVNVTCVAGQALPCELTITGLSSTSYVARMKSVYDSAQVVIGALETVTTPGPPVTTATDIVEFSRAQTSIDVTAKATDIVRRLRVAIPFAEVKSPPEAVFQSFDGVCKLLQVRDNPLSITDPCGTP